MPLLGEERQDIELFRMFYLEESQVGVYDLEKEKAKVGIGMMW